MNDSVAVVRVNNIEVGSMPVTQYEEIVRSVKKDWRTRIASVFSYIRFISRMAIRLWSYFVKSFAVIFALFMLYSIFHLDEITQFISEMRNLPSESIAVGIRSIANICFTLTIFAFAASLFINGTPVFVSATENAINKKIREVMEVPAEGQVSITFTKDGAYCVR
ncbi:hypothetical protein ABHY64_004359 [Yersinia enterocolitica]|uniref:hypothetical protein n=1 Tax=Klebsiella pneumoniae TaxID=573 RepID=UPI0006676ACA|nr:hypothetical protein [Klebsiella pneumoniae]EKN4845364.1 hypothetical protein [Yersinia enterocolitica]MDK6337014.1 hypothetical protein [Escherichia coli]MDK7088844.1 hypothetical protein [Escherichia coli]